MLRPVLQRIARWGHCLALMLLISSAALLGSCATNPVTGKRQLSLMSESQEIALGAQSDESIVAQYGLVRDDALAAYVQSVGQKMVPVSHRPDLSFHFRLLDDTVVNAFALPGGYVYITRGILAYLNSEAALAGVMGHEIGHVTARHGAQRYTKQAILGLGLGVGSVLSESFAKYADVAGGAAGLLLLKYGRNDERQADQLGVEYASKVGYDTHDMANFFATLQRLTPADGRLPSWMSTHPDPGERYETVGALTQQWESKLSGPFALDRDRFLQHLEGMVFGPDPRDGFVDGGVFHHPRMRFRFPVPAGWKLQNGRSQVVMVSAKQDAAVIFTLAQQPTATAAADAFLHQEGITPLDRNPVHIAGQPGLRTLVRARKQDGSEQIVRSTFFGYQGQVFVFHGITTEARYTAMSALLVASADGFETETDPAVLNVEPVMVHVIAAPFDGRFAEVAARYPIPARAGLDLGGLALMNGMEITTPVTKGQRLKVLREGS